MYNKATNISVMKKSIFIYFVLASMTFLSTTIAGGNRSTLPTKILSITQELHEIEYYKEQVMLWNQETLQDNSDSNAWMNYYLASRIVNMLTPEKNPHDLTDIYNQMSNYVKGTYEHHYLTYLDGKGDHTLFHHIEKAFDMDPTRTEVLSHLVNYYAVTGNEELMARYNKLWLESGQISSGILSWNYNALIALEEEAILLTYGDNDTYPAWMLQQVHDIRPDVKVINIHLLRKREYIDHVFQDCKIPLYPKQDNEIIVWENDLVPIVDHMIDQSDRPIYVNVTLPKKIRDNYQDKLYTVGLAFKYSADPFDNMATLKNNYENKFLTDYLRLGFSYDKSVTVLNSLNVNYLPAFISLYKHYIKSENYPRADNIKEVIYNIGEASGRSEEVANVLEVPRALNKNIESHMDIKQIDKTMVIVEPAIYSTEKDKNLKIKKHALYAASTETTNELYGQFLMDLLKQKEYELLEICKSDKVDWTSLLPHKYKNLTEKEYSRNGHPDSPQAPVVNISYKAAKKYCEWLTMVYNGYEKKKKHMKVIFRLPTEKEWTDAAKAGKQKARYPWGGFYHKNSKGCFLANFESSEEEPCHDCAIVSLDNDGGFFLVNASAYFPNDYGLYGISGNAAEIVEGGKFVVGGSWQDKPSDCTIDSKKPYSAPSPSIGFRVFMEVIR